MTGRRLPDGEIAHMDPGDYQRDEHGGWWVCVPNGDACNVSTWTVVEHEDKTITVSPSILVHATPPRTYTAAERERLVEMCGAAYVEKWERGKPGWHGFLERGVWREC